MKKFYYLGITLFASIFLSAQENHTVECATDHLMDTYFKENPNAKKEYDAFNLEIAQLTKSGELKRTLSSKSKLNKEGVYEIPIVVHVISKGDAVGTVDNPDDQQIIDWINYTNDVFAGKAENMLSANDGGVVIPVKFVFAQIDPKGNTTTGIDRIDLSGNTKFVTYGLNGSAGYDGLHDKEVITKYGWEASKYYNIYVAHKIASGTVVANGYASYPTGDLSNDRSVMLASVSKVGQQTMAHEFGHGLGLRHTHEGYSAGTATLKKDENGKYVRDENNDYVIEITKASTCPTNKDCNVDGDGVCDTEPAVSLYDPTVNLYRCLTNGINQCTGQTFAGVEKNIMSYTYCFRDRFTQGQVDRALIHLFKFREGLINSPVLQHKKIDNKVEITAAACKPTKIDNSGNTFRMGTVNVTFNEINNWTNPYNAYENYFYKDYIGSAYTLAKTTTSIPANNTTKLSVKTAEGSNNLSIKAYIDYNNDGAFDEKTEAVLAGSAIKPGSVTSINITAPANTVLNKALRMRVFTDFTGTDITSCRNPRYGDVEDYAVTFTTTKTIWNGTSWSNGVPTATSEAIIEGDLNITSNLEAYSITLNSGSVNVKSGSNLKVTSDIINNLSADKFIFEDNTNLIQTFETAVNKGNFTVIKNSTPMVFNDATYWSSPVTGQNVRNFSPKTLDKRFYTYDETTNKFASLFVNDPLYPNTNLKNPTSYTFENGLGYHIRVSNTHTQVEPGTEYVGTFVGTLNNGIYSQNLTKKNLGFNLIGNPYPSSISATKFLNDNVTINALYFWTHEAPLTTAGYASNNYASYNLTGGTQAAAGGEIPTGIIAKGQGFIAETQSTATIKFNNAQRLNSNATFFKSSEEAPKRIWIDLFEGTQAKNQILIGYLENATNDFDPRMDAKLNQNYEGSALYSTIENNTDKFVIQGRALPFTKNDVVNLGLDAKAKASFTFKLNNTENVSDDTTIFIYDKKDKQIVDLRKQSYTFDSEEGTFTDRFELVYTNSTLGLNEVKTQEAILFKKDGNVTIQSPTEISTVEVFDITGRKITTKNATSKSVTITNLPKSNQLLLFKITTKDNKTITLKTIL